jgi:1-acyl-sn-glycerol-3-phosphate acyltransferase
MVQSAKSNKPSFGVYLGSSLFFLYIVISTIVFGPIILLAIVLPFGVRYKLSVLWVKWLLWVLKKTCHLTYEVEGAENIPKDSPCVVLCKHQSAWETVALRLILPKQTAVLKKSLTWIPIGGWALATLKPIAIDRSNQREALKRLIEQGRQRLKEGFFVIVFPEGTRAAPGENKKFNAGGAMLAQKSGYPVLPIAHNAGEYWPRYSFLKYPGTIKVKIGPLIEVEGLKPKEINEKAAKWIELAMQEIGH